MNTIIPILLPDTAAALRLENALDRVAELSKLHEEAGEKLFAIQLSLIKKAATVIAEQNDENKRKLVFTPKMIEELRKAYHDALAASFLTFTFHGQELVTGYAKYLLEYLDMQTDQALNRKSYS